MVTSSRPHAVIPHFYLVSARASFARLAMRPLVVAMACLLPLPVLANCITTGTTTVCDTTPPSPWTSTLGTGFSTPSGSILNVQTNARVSTGNAVAISYGDNARINLAAGAIVQNAALPGSNGPLGLGANTIEFGSNGILTVNAGAQVLANGTAGTSEAVNVYGGGNQIINYGLISGTPGAAIYFESRTAGTNTVDNYGTIRSTVGASANVIGSGGNGPVVFINRTGARIEGSLGFAGGNDTFTLEAGSVVTGNFNGGGGSNTLNLAGTAGSSDTLTGSVTNFSTLNKTGDGLWTISGTLGNSGTAALAVNVQQGTLALTGNNSNIRGSVFVDSDGTLQARAQSLPPAVTNQGLVRFTQPDAGTYTGVISGAGRVEKTDVGVLTLSGANTYSGGTTIKGGMVAIGADAAIGAAAGGVILDGGTLGLTSSFNIGATRAISVTANNGGIDTAAGVTTVLTQSITGPGRFTKSSAGTLTLTGANAYTGGTTISGGTLQLGNGGTTGSLVGDVVDNGTLAFNRSDDLTYANAVSGTGVLRQLGPNTLTLTAANSYTGTTAVDAGALYVNGNQSAATGATTVANGATLGGTGTLGGAVTVADGGILSPGGNSPAPGTLTLNGNLGLSGGSILNYSLGQAGVPGGAFNDLTNVGGNLTLDGTLNVVTAPGGTFGAGVYRLINYGGALTNNGLAVGTVPSPNYSVQTSVANQVNLVNTNGLTLNYWDGVAGPKNNGAVNGGNGVWQNASGNDNWTTSDGTVNAPFANGSFAIFEATPSTVTVDNGLGNVTISGAQFASDGYVVQGAPITLVGSPADPSQSIIRVGDGTLVGAGYTATVNSVLQGTSGLTKSDLGTLVLNAANTYTGNTAIDGGTLQIASDANLGGAAGGLSFDDGSLHTTASFTSNRAVTLNAGGGTLNVDNGTTLTLGGVIGGVGALTKSGAGIGVLVGDNTFTGLTTIGAGTLQLGNGGTTGAVTGDILDNAALTINHSNTVTVSGTISGTGSLAQNGTGTTILTAANSFTGGTTINAGTLQLGNGGTTGSLAGDVVDNGTLAFNRSDDLTYANAVSGTGGLRQLGPNALTLTAANSYTGTTAVDAGALYVNGNQSAATGATTVANGATLGGIGTLGGNVTIADGGILAPGGNSPTPGTLTLNGSLGLSAGSVLNYSFGQANVPGGALNDLVNVGGNLTLDGTLNVVASPGGSFDPGVYRVINYNGALINNGLTVGTIPSAGFFVQTGVANQVNLINTNGLTLNYWDGAAGPGNNDVVNGGDGTWQNINGNTNWTDQNGIVNAFYADRSFAVFEATPGTVTVDNSLGNISVAGMQFASNGYIVQGDPITLAGTVADPTQSIIRVGDGSTAGAGYVATIGSVLTGTSGLTKSDLGTLVLNAANTYTGNTAINGGTLQIASDASLGGAAGSLSFNGGTLHTTANVSSNRAQTLNAGGGTLLTDAGTVLTLGGTVGGAGALTTSGAGTVVLLTDATYAGGTTIGGGVLQLGNGGTSGSILGNVANQGTLAFNRSDTVTFGGVISGTGSLSQSGSGTTILTGTNSYTGDSTISAGTLQLGNGGTSGSLVGNVANNGTLIFNRSDVLTFDGTISGTGDLQQNGAGTTILTGANSYAGPTAVNAGSLYVNGNQSAATGATSVTNGATLGGTGTIGGDVVVADGGTLSPGGNGFAPGTLSVNGNLGLSGGSILNYSFGKANVSGGAFNDLTNVNGNLTLDGTLNVSTSQGGDFAAGVYRVINYAGTLTDHGLVIGTIPSVTFQVQTAVANQVNLINTAGLNLNFWDGAAGPKNNGAVNGGDGTWQNANGNDNWTDANGVVNAPYADRSFAIFEGAKGTVTIDNSLGDVTIAGAQFAADGYTLQGDAITLAGTVADPTHSVIRIGDGSSDGAGYTTTINNVLQGSSGLTKTDLGTLVLNGINTYTGGTAINGGTVQVTNDSNLGNTAGGLSFDDGNLQTTVNLSTARAVTLNDGGGTLTAANGSTLTLSGAIGGTGGLTTAGTGTTILTGINNYVGPTTVNAGRLLVNGDQSAATGATTVASGATLGGTGTLGGSVTVSDGGILSPGTPAAPGILSINGDLGLSGGSILNYRFGQANVVGGPLNDLVNVGRNLTLDGTLNVTTSPGGLFGPGVYRVFNYAGTLTDNGLTLGNPTPDLFVQTSVANQVNLVNTEGLALTYWDGAAGPKNNSVVNGGDGSWQSIQGNDNWTDATGALNAPYADRSFAVFEGAKGTVTVDNSLGNVTIAGAQFATTGYTIQGGPITLSGSTTDPNQTVIRVGDGTAAGGDITATVNSTLVGTSGLTKVDLGTLVLGGANTYTGATTISGGTVQIASDSNLGNATGALNFYGGTLHTTATFSSNRAVTVNTGGGTLNNDANTTLTLNAISGVGGLTKAGTGTTLLNGSSTYQGPTTVSAGTLVIGDANHSAAALAGGATTTVASGATLGGYGKVNGDVDNQGSITVANALTTLGAGPTGNVTINGTLRNVGLAQLGGSGVGNTLTVTNYTGQDGQIALNAQLGGDGSPSDQLVILGGKASGSSTLTVSNVGGMGALTPGNGILVVNPINGGSTSPGAFSLGNRAVAGPYEYTLFRGGRNGDTPDAYYLRTEAADNLEPNGGGDINGNNNNESEVPNYRREVSDYTALSSMMANFGRATIGSLHERVGEEAHLPTDSGGVEGVWARVIGQDGKWNAKSGGIYRDGPSFDDNFVAVQAGADLFHEEDPDGSRNRAGIYGVAGHGHGDVQHYDGSNAGFNQFDGYSIGLYWTHYTPSDAYLDTVLQGTSYQNVKSGSSQFGQLKTEGFSFAASVEAGMPFKLKNQWQIEPQAQLIYQGVSLDDGADRAAQVSFGNLDSLAGRVGARLARGWVLEDGAHPRRLDLWFNVNVWHEFNANPVTSVSSEDGYVPFRSDLKGTWYEVQAGVSTQVSRTTSLYANLGYDKGFNHGAQAVNGTIGIRVNW